jgi:hypothetical protein
MATDSLGAAGPTNTIYRAGIAPEGSVEGAGTAGLTPAGNMDARKTTTQYVALDQASPPRISNPNGSPCIGSPILPFSAADLAIQLASLTSKTKDAQTESLVNGLQLSKLQMEAKSTEGIEKIKEWQANTIEAAAKAREAAESSWFEKICNAIVGVVLAVVTAPLALTGLGTPLFAMALGMAIDSCTACENNARALETPPREPLESFGKPHNQLAFCFV